MRNVSRKWVFVVLSIIIFIIPASASFYKYYYTKNYDYLVEARCDPLAENCFSRDCTNPDDCPPNGLSIYKKFFVKAFDFAKCSDNSCEKECSNGFIECSPIPCGESEDDVCTQSVK
jgi:hypothetical protein